MLSGMGKDKIFREKVPQAGRPDDGFDKGPSLKKKISQGPRATRIKSENSRRQIRFHGNRQERGAVIPI